MLNETLNYLTAHSPLSTIAFSGAVTTISVGLPGPGGQSSSGFPMPRHGYLIGLHVWDGTTYRHDSDEIAFQAGDRVSIYCQNMGSDFALKVRVNGSSTNLSVGSVPFNSTLFATIEFSLLRD